MCVHRAASGARSQRDRCACERVCVCACACSHLVCAQSAASTVHPATPTLPHPPTQNVQSIACDVTSGRLCRAPPHAALNTRTRAWLATRHRAASMTWVASHAFADVQQGPASDGGVGGARVGGGGGSRAWACDAHTAATRQASCMPPSPACAAAVHACRLQGSSSHMHRHRHSRRNPSSSSRCSCSGCSCPGAWARGHSSKTSASCASCARCVTACRSSCRCAPGQRCWRQRGC
jgi:hypothetical protein